MVLARHVVVLVVGSVLLVGPWMSTTTTAQPTTEMPMYRVCGSRLVDVVWMLCLPRGGLHNRMDRGNLGTGIPRPPYKLYRPAQTRFQHLPDHIKAHYEGPLSLTEIVPRQSWTPEGGGIVEECCKKACTLATLTSYCASPTVLPTMVEMSRLFSSEDSGMQADQAPPKPETTGEAPLQPQQVEDVDKEHNEVDRAGTRGSDGQEAHGSTSVGRLLSPATAFLRDPDEESAFGPRPRIGTFSRHRPYWYVVQAAFNDNVEDGA